MADDDLDPALLDFDSPAHGSSSLGAGFGSSLDNDDDDLAFGSSAHDELELGSGFGSALGAELDGPNGLAGLEGAHDSPAHEPATPARRRGNGSTMSEAGAGAQLSLAAELASAARPERHRDLLNELGLGGSDDDDGAQDEEQYSEDEVGSAGMLGSGFGQGNGGMGARAGGADPFSASPRRAPSRQVRTRPSSASLAHPMHPSRGGVPSSDDEEAEVRTQEQVDAALREATASLDDSVQTITTFLAHLRQHVTAEINSSAPVPSVSAASSAIPNGFPHPSSASAPLDYTDRQPIVESISSTLVRRLHDLAKQRESQLRELTEVERVFARNESGWRAVLADLDPLDFDDDELPIDGVEHAPNGVNGVDSHLPPNAPAPASPVPPAAPRRKLRALKTQATALRDELAALERSEEFVRAYEEKEEPPVLAQARAGGGSAEGPHAARARREVDVVRQTLDEGWKRAQSILAVRS
ncbi:hypothetical protein Rhopal_003121-T1 [Rhodotorula paludigena]|uniref:Uncharacterized protein n=1 Tax=Rhodotorula paludigena TaxID=86838 RepID=A0AAV5GKX2_9BASI|nr:hypothetical protein Rhopal_003121-T1 [Rhodotorula paludigena]